MSTHENEALVRRYFDECVARASGSDQAHALEVVDELLAPDFTMYYNDDEGEQALRGRERHKQFLVEHARIYPEDRWRIEALVADDEMVACHWRFEARHAATGNAVRARAADFFRTRNGRLWELRRFLDFHGLREQTRRRRLG